MLCLALQAYHPRIITLWTLTVKTLQRDWKRISHKQTSGDDTWQTSMTPWFYDLALLMWCDRFRACLGWVSFPFNWSRNRSGLPQPAQGSSQPKQNCCFPREEGMRLSWRCRRDILDVRSGGTSLKSWTSPVMLRGNGVGEKEHRS